MQLLTASKLSTVAMLAMAAVLHFSVSAVPMEQSAEVVPLVEEVVPMEQPVAVEEVVPAVEEVMPAAKAPIDLSAYASPVPGQPSPKAIEDMIAVYNWLYPPSPQEDAPLPPNEAPKPASRSSRKADKKAITGKSLKHLKELAKTSQYNFNLVKRQLPQLTQKLITNLDEAWKRLEHKLRSKQRHDRLNEILASSAWEKTLKSTFGLKKLEKCPYYLISGLGLGQLLDLKLGLKPLPSPPSRIFRSDWMTNICLLAVNGGYYWLMRILTMGEYHTLNDILSVLSPLRLFSPDKTLIQDIDNVLSLFTLVAKANSMRVPANNHHLPLLMLAVPNVIDALEVNRQDSMRASLFLLAIQQYQQKPELGIGLASDMKMFLEYTEIGNMDAIALSLYQHSDEQYLFREYLNKLTNNIFHVARFSRRTKGAIVNSLLDYSPRELIVDANHDVPGIHYDRYDCLNIMEMLVNVLDLNQFISLYGKMANEHKGLSLIVMAGRSRKGSEIMFHVFSDILGEQGMPIKDGVQVDGQPLTAGHLAELVQGCVMACTEDNWRLFLGELLDRLKVTEHLPGGDDETLDKVEAKDGLAQLLPSERIANEIKKLVQRLNTRFRELNPVNVRTKQNPGEEAVQEATTRMNEAIEKLNNINNSYSNTKKKAHRG